MTPEQFHKAKPIVEIIRRLEKSLTECNDAIEFEETEYHKKETTLEQRPTLDDGMNGGYNLYVHQHKDGSGKWSVDLTGTWSALEFLKVTKSFIEDKLSYYNDVLEDI